ncbi:MAG TPA: hypothetical protein PLL77_01600 [Pyrinomonadaceae bacterium]|nr:hypothetical protein [Pyrinomonadaceae bacterium]
MKVFSIILLSAMFGVTGFAQQDAKVIAETWTSGDKVVKGQPFSAEAVSESVQTLSDGNRIVHNSTTKLYRNSEGRFRREITGGTGGVMGEGYSFEPGVTITDQLGGRLLLDSTMRTVRPLAMVEPRKIEIPSLTAEQKAALEKLRVELKLTDTSKITEEQRQTIKKLKEELNINIPLIVTPEGFKPAHTITTTVNGSLFGGTAKAIAPGAPLTGALTLATTVGGQSKYETKTEQLGSKNIEGIEVEGTRTVTTIPAGAIGNERPIETVYEKWYSKELQLVVMSKRTDPRFGEQTYRLTNLVRSEPDPSLFNVPAGYKPYPSQSGFKTYSTYSDAVTAYPAAVKKAPTASKPATAPKPLQ